MLKTLIKPNESGPSLFLESKREMPNASWPIHIRPGFIWSMLQTNLTGDATDRLSTWLFSGFKASLHWTVIRWLPCLSVGIVPKTFEALSRSRTVTTPCQSTVHTSSPMQIASEQFRNCQQSWNNFWANHGQAVSSFQHHFLSSERGAFVATNGGHSYRASTSQVHFGWACRTLRSCRISHLTFFFLAF